MAGWLGSLLFFFSPSSLLLLSFISPCSPPGFRIVHFSIQGHHIHLLCEASHKHALAGGVKAFGSSCAQRINRMISPRTGKRVRGSVFADRYHVRAIHSVAQTRNALAYVLNNFRHHKLTGPTLAEGRVDYYSQGFRRARPISVYEVPGAVAREAR